MQRFRRSSGYQLLATERQTDRRTDGQMPWTLYTSRLAGGIKIF